jgi:hypothetical protein
MEEANESASGTKRPVTEETVATTTANSVVASNATPEPSQPSPAKKAVTTTVPAQPTTAQAALQRQIQQQLQEQLQQQLQAAAARGQQVRS